MPVVVIGIVGDVDGAATGVAEPENKYVIISFAQAEKEARRERKKTHETLWPRPLSTENPLLSRAGVCYSIVLHVHSEIGAIINDVNCITKSHYNVLYIIRR